MVSLYLIGFTLLLRYISKYTYIYLFHTYFVSITKYQLLYYIILKFTYTPAETHCMGPRLAIVERARFNLGPP